MKKFSAPELDRDLEEFLSQFKDFIHVNYLSKCNQLKEKESLIQSTQHELNLTKEAVISATNLNIKLQDNLNRYKDILEQNTLLEGDINKLLREKRDLETSLLTEQELLRNEKNTWKNEKLKITEEFRGQIIMLNKRHVEEKNYMNDCLTMEIRELERKVSSIEDELAFSKLNHDEVIKQTKKVNDEKLKKKDIEILALKDELNYWRERNYSYQLQHKIRDANQKKELYCFYSDRLSMFNSNSNDNISNLEHNEINLLQKTENQQKSKFQFQGKQKCLQSGVDMNYNIQDFINLKEQTSESHPEIESMKGTKHSSQFESRNSSVNKFSENIDIMESQQLVSDQLENTALLNLPKTLDEKNVQINLSENSSVIDENVPLEQRSPLSKENKPRAIVEPMKKKLQFPVIKKKKLLNPKSDYL